MQEKGKAVLTSLVNFISDMVSKLSKLCILLNTDLHDTSKTV